MTERPYNRTLGRLRLATIYLLVGTLLALARPTSIALAVGVPFILLGEAARLWAAGHLHKNVELVTSGPYRYTRNPLYLGRLLIFIGLAVAATLPFGSNWIVLLGGLAIFFGYYLPRKERVEPARLLEIHGESFERYHREVPALFPTWTPYREDSSADWSSARMLANREHWMVVALLIALLVLIWRVA